MSNSGHDGLLVTAFQRFRRLCPLAQGGAKVVAVLLLSAEFSLTGAQPEPSLAAPAQNLPILTSAQLVLDLGLDGSRRAPHRVRLRGLVTYPEPGAHMIYVQDSSAGLRVVYTNANFQPASGQMVAVEGMVAAGMFAPFVDQADVQVVGLASIPEPCEAPASRMAAGELFGQWVQVEGVVRDVAKEADRAQLFISSAGLRFHAVVQPFPGMHLPVEWLDARVVLRGVCWTDVDAENKPEGFTLYVPGTNFISFLHSGRTDPFAQPAVSVHAQAELRRQSDTRVKVAGVVAFHSLGGHLYLHEGGSALHARLLAPLARSNPQALHVERASVVPLRPGARVEVVGAPTAATFAPFLQDAEFRSLGTEAPPLPVSVTGEDIFSGRYDSQLVSVRARVLACDNRQAGPLKHQVLALQMGGTIFEAWSEFVGTNGPPPLQKNSYVEATGICLVQLGELNQIRSFRLLLREPRDLRLLGRPPWWEHLPVGRMLMGAITLGVAALIWIWLLRRQVRHRTAELQGEVQERQRAQTELQHTLMTERELSELRSRFVSMVSHEFRTPLGVILSSAENLDSYFERLQAGQRRGQLNNIMQATRHMGKMMEEVLLLGRAEAGKLEYKPVPLDLAAFCERITTQVLSATGGRCPIHFRAETLPPARGDEDLLRHILTNLLSNAVKYSHDGEAVDFSVEVDAEEAIFRFRDRGIGISAIDQKQLFQAFHRGRNASHLPGSGLGLVIVKRCVELHHGEIHCESSEGSGTTFTVKLPLFCGAETSPVLINGAVHKECL